MGGAFAFIRHSCQLSRCRRPPSGLWASGEDPNSPPPESTKLSCLSGRLRSHRQTWDHGDISAGRSQGAVPQLFAHSEARMQVATSSGPMAVGA